MLFILYKLSHQSPSVPSFTYPWYLSSDYEEVRAVLPGLHRETSENKTGYTQVYFSASRQIKRLSWAIKQTLPEINQIVSYRKVMGNAKGLWSNICLGWWVTLSGENDADTFFYIFLPLFYVKILSVFTFSQNSSATISVKKQMFGNMENSHHCFDPAVNLLYFVSPHHSPWEFNASSPLCSPPLPSPHPPSFFPLLFSSFHCNLLFLCPQNCSSR